MLLLLLAFFAISLVLAVALFAAATRALHLPADREGELDGTIRYLGSWHSGLLLVAVVVLGGLMFIFTLTELKSEESEDSCCCIQGEMN